MLLLSCWLAMGWLLNSGASASVELQCKEVQTIRTTGVGSGTSCSPSVIRRTVWTCLCNLWPPHCRHTSLWTARWQVVNCGRLDRCFMRCTCTTSPSAKRVFRAAPVSIATTIRTLPVRDNYVLYRLFAIPTRVLTFRGHSVCVFGRTASAAVRTNRSRYHLRADSRGPQKPLY